jgi:type I restriction enzyme S subunit
VRLPAYQRYKPSGVEWLGEVPEHWNTKRLGYVASINDEALPETTDPDFEMSYVDIGGVDPVRGITAVETLVFENAPSRARRIVRHGDTIVSTVRTYLRAIAPITSPKPNTIVSTGFAVVRPRGTTPQFTSYALRESGFVDAIVARSVGVSYPAINASDIGMLPIPLPSKEEQTGIADFLDRETGKIDTLVAKKRTVVERLKEKRTALISRTVTLGLPPDAARAAGLDPHPKLKPSGIDWLGDVPAHWGVIAFKRLCSRVDVGIAEAATHAYADDGVPIIRSKNVRPNRLDTEDVLRIEQWFAEKNRSKTLHAGDLVTVRTGYPGTTAAIPAEFEGSQCFTLVMSTLKPSENPRYFSYFFNADPGTTHFQMEGWGTAQTNISVPIVQNMPVLRPPKAEQVAIVSYLDAETARLDALIFKVESVVCRLQEYRTALLTAAVTGKIDVRGTVG